MKFSSSPGGATRRWTSAAVVFGAVSAVLATPLALGTASAAPPPPVVTNVTISSTTNAASGGTATITGTYSPAAGAGGTAPSIEYTIQGGSADTATFPAGTACTAQTDGTFSCSVHNSGTAGTDSVRVFADNNGDNNYNTAPTPEPSDTTTVVFSGAPSTIHFTTAPTSAATDTCVVYTAHVADSGGNNATGQSVNLTVTEVATSTPTTNPITLFPADCSGGGTAGGSATGNTITFTHTFTVDNSGNVSFGLASADPGTATVKLANSGNTVSDQATTTFTAGGANSVTSLTVTPPTTQTGFTGSTLSFTVTAKDASNNAVQGVTVMEETTNAGAPDTLAPTACGTTNASGAVTCSVHNGGTAGTDNLTFWVNNTTSTPRTNGPDTGEPQATATATFNAQPAVDSAHSSLTCVQGLSGPTQGTAQTDCTVPTTQHSVTFTATVKDASGNPIPNVTVTFTATSAKLGGATVTGGSLPSGTGTTNSSGVATFTVQDPSAANGDNVTVHAAVGSASVGTATAHWVAATATTLTLNPPLQSVQKGGTVTVHAQVVDQFGTPLATQPIITYSVSGRNNGVSGTAVNGTITYVDTGINGASNTDTITAHDVADGLTGTAIVDYTTGPATPSTVTVDTSGSGTTDGTCAATGHTPATGVSFNHVTTVCALVKNANGEVLAGQTVTFTVSSGQVGAVGKVTPSTSGTTFQTTTDAAGVAFADVTSTKTGVQTVTATAGTATGSSTITYSAPAATDAFTIALAPATPTVAPGASQKFTATVTDKFGNPVTGVSVNFTQSGPGSIGGASSATVVTGTDGTASVTLTTASTDSGSGSITATIGTAGTQCNSAPTGTPPSKCTASTTYTVAATVAPSHLTLSPETGAHAGTHETIHAVVTNSNGTPAAHQIVRFFVTGANSATGSAISGPAGHASFSYLALHHGTDSIAAYVDTNNDQIREANEPRQFATAHILSNAKRAEHPSISLSTHSLDSTRGRVTIHVTTHPRVRHAFVIFYEKIRGKWQRIGNARTGHLGKAGRTFTVPAGKRTFKAHVNHTSTTKGGSTPAATIRVHHA